MRKVLRVGAGSIAIMLVLAVAVLLVMGARPDAETFQSSQEIDRRPEEIWPWLRDGDKLKKWVSWLVEVRPTGEKSHVWVMADMNNGGQKMEIQGVLTDYAPPNQMRVQLASPGNFNGWQGYRLTSLGGGKSRLEITGQYHFSTWFARLLSPLIMPQAKKKMVGDLARLKTFVEQSPIETAGR